MGKNNVHEHTDFFGKLHTRKDREDMPSEKSKNAKLNKNSDRFGYVKHNIEMTKHNKTAIDAKVIEATYNNMPSRCGQL